MNDMNDAVRLIAAKSQQAAREAMRFLRTPDSSPLRQGRYNRIAEWALSDGQAEFTSDERALIVSLVVGEDEDGSQERRTNIIHVRLSDTERDTLEQEAARVGDNVSNYIRRKLEL